MIDLITEIRGPEFIALYIVYFIIIFIIMNIYILFSDTSRNMPLTVSLKDEGIMVLLLRYGNKPGIIIKGIIMNLFSRKLLAVNEEGKITQVNPERSSSLTGYEKTVYDYYTSPEMQESILSNEKVMQKTKEMMDNLYEELIRMKLVKGPDFIREELKKIYILMAIFYIPGIIKLIAGIMRERPVAYLVMIFIASIVVFSIKISKTKKTVLTQLGKKFLKELIKKYSTYKITSPNTSPFPSGMQPALYMALFGASALLLFPEYGIFQNTFAGTVNTTYGCSSCSMMTDSSSDSGCSGCSSSDGGGCSGCGGCGGGD